MKKLFACLALTASLLSYTSGKLENGLQYHLKQSTDLQGRGSIWLVLNIGMLQETNQQKGVAHLTEHVAWSGIEKPPIERFIMIADLLGISDAPERANSTTEMDATFFRLDNIALNDPRALDTALFCLKEIVSAATFSPEFIEQEWPDVLQDLLDEVGSFSYRKLECQLEALFQQPIILCPDESFQNTQNASAPELKAFYQTHYRPDKMALIAVGDFDEKLLESKINHLFTTLTNPSHPAPIPSSPLLNPIFPTRALFLQLDTPAVPKLSLMYPLPRTLDLEVQYTLRPLIEARLQPLIDAGHILSITYGRTALSPTYQILEVGISLLNEASLPDIQQSVIERLSHLDALTQEEWLRIQSKEPDNDIDAQCYADLFLGRLLSRPLHTSFPSQTTLLRCNTLLQDSPTLVTFIHQPIPSFNPLDHQPLRPLR
jgi:hypothetical protein